MTPKEFLEITGDFCWLWTDFFIETSVGNFVWRDPGYSGDNTIRYTSKRYEEICKEYNIPYGRDKGKHIIGEYCGRDLIFTKAAIGRLSALEVPQ